MKRLRNADFGLRIDEGSAASNPQSETRIPQSDIISGAEETGTEVVEVTEAVKQKLQHELDELDQELRVILPQQIKTAKEWGDLRENAEYHAALARQQFVQARIQQLRQRLREVSSIDLSKVPHGKAAYGSTLVLYDAEREEEVTYRLVTPEESDPNAGLISTTSPVGRSLMGREEGDEVKVTTPSGTRNFEIKKLTTMHDQQPAGDD
jgi:transcription elongation factor GreA